MAMTTVRKILAEKPEITIYTVNSTDTVLEALKAMDKANTGSILVSEGGKIVGIFTERDYTRQGELKGRVAKDTPVSEVMTRQMVMVKPETTLQECAELMKKYNIRHLPVLDKERVVGMVSIRSLAEALLDEQKGTIVGLENYIMGTGYGQ
jgi:CBS domain-containing protein